MNIKIELKHIIKNKHKSKTANFNAPSLIFQIMIQ